VVGVPIAVAPPSRKTRYCDIPLASVDAVQLTSTEVADWAVAVTPAGTVGAVVSPAGGGGGGDESSPPPPQAASINPNDAVVANIIDLAILRTMPESRLSGINLEWRSI
jgi:hypothetical protein